MVAITLNGRAVEAPEGTTVLEAATAAGVQIPTLCYLKDLNCIGSCRVCLVDVEGEGLAASCNTAVREGMVVRTDTPQVAVARRANLQAIMDDHRALCATCVRQDTCALRDLASTFNLADAPGPLPEPAPWDADFPLQRDSSKCIKCMRCVAICEKVQHCAVWDFTGVGPSTKIIVRDNLPIAEAGCALCGQCITHCPTGALVARDDVSLIMEAILDPAVETVVQVAPAVRPAGGEGLGLYRGDNIAQGVDEALVELEQRVRRALQGLAVLLVACAADVLWNVAELGVQAGHGGVLFLRNFLNQLIHGHKSFSPLCVFPGGIPLCISW